MASEETSLTFHFTTDDYADVCRILSEREHEFDPIGVNRTMTTNAALLASILRLWESEHLARVGKKPKTQCCAQCGRPMEEIGEQTKSGRRKYRCGACSIELWGDPVPARRGAP